MRTALWVLAGILAGAPGLAGCAHRLPPECPYGDRAKGECPSHTGQPLDTFPPLRGLSKEGRTAFRTLLEARYFTTATVARSMRPSPEVEAWRVLFREKEGEAAFRCLASCTRPPRPGKLFGLCGLRFFDRNAFQAEVNALRADFPSGTVPTFFYCIVDEDTPLARVLPEIENGGFSGDFRGAE